MATPEEDATKQDQERSKRTLSVRLVTAALKNDTKLVAQVLDQGACVNSTHTIPWRLLFSDSVITECAVTALVAGCRSYSIDAVKLLLSHGADPNIPGKFKHGGFTTPLFTAIEQGKLEIAIILVEHGALINTIGYCELDESTAMTPLAGAAFFKSPTHILIMKMILQHRAQVDSDVSQVTALMTSALYNNVEAARFLLNHGAQVDYKSNGWTALMSAVVSNNIDTARELLVHGANIDMKGLEGVSALMLAAYAGYTNIVELLIKRGAQIDLKNNDGETALSMAERHGHTDIVKMLEDGQDQQDLDHIVQVLDQTEIHDNPTPNPTTTTRTENTPFRTIEDTRLEPTCTISQEVQNLSGADQTEIHDISTPNPPNLTTIATVDNTISQNVENLSGTAGETQQRQPSQNKSERPELAKALRLVHQLASKWQNIGVLLNFEPGILESIKMKELNIPSNCLREMLTEWWSRMNPPPTWQALGDAVRVYDPRRAQQIENLYKQK